MSSFGREFAKECEYLYKKPLHVLGYTLEGFFVNLIDVLEVLQQSPSHAEKLKTKNDIPVLLCNQQSGRLAVHFYTNRSIMKYFMAGVIKGISECLFRRKVKINLLSCDPPPKVKHRYYFKYSVSDDGEFGEDELIASLEKSFKLKESHSESSILDKSINVDNNIHLERNIKLESTNESTVQDKNNHSEKTPPENFSSQFRKNVQSSRGGRSLRSRASAGLFTEIIRQC